MLYKITTSVEGYTGVIAGIAFSNGEGETDNSWLADWFTEKGYSVEEVNEDNTKMSGEENGKNADPNVTGSENENEMGTGEKDLASMNMKELKALAKDQGIGGYSSLSKEELIALLGD